MSSTTGGLHVRSRECEKSIPQFRFETLHRAGLFLKNFARYPHLVASAIPSSRYLINRALDHVDWDAARSIVEYGPGVGTFTRHILSRMSPDSRLLAIDLNAEFCQFLTNKFEDSRFEVVHGSASNVRELMRQRSMYEADVILSGIPCTFLPLDVRHSILTATREMLSPSGVFINYQYTRSLRPDLRAVFSQVEEDFELMNILPARLFYCSA